MTDRDRLINELKKAKNRCLIHESGGCLACKYRGQADCTLENLADHLLANGVIAPPCKVGDVVYAVGDKDGHQIKECKVNHFSFESAEHFEVDVYFDCDLDCDGCYFQTYSQSYCGEWDCDNAYGHSCIPIADFGKTVFLTKEEALKKLKELRE